MKAAALSLLALVAGLACASATSRLLLRGHDDGRALQARSGSFGSCGETELGIRIWLPAGDHSYTACRNAEVRRTLMVMAEWIDVNYWEISIIMGQDADGNDIVLSYEQYNLHLGKAGFVDGQEYRTKYEPEKDEVAINVRDWTSGSRKSFNVYVPFWATVMDLKLAIQDYNGVVPGEQRLFLLDPATPDDASDETLNNYDDFVAPTILIGDLNDSYLLGTGAKVALIRTVIMNQEHGMGR